MKITKTWFKKEIEITPEEIEAIYDKLQDTNVYLWLTKVLNWFLK